MNELEAPVLPIGPDIDMFRSVRPFYRRWLTEVIEWIVRRYESRPDYRFLDTKHDVINRRDFDDDDEFRGPDAVFGWIQGRGLESLVVHAEWLGRSDRGSETNETAALVQRIDRIIDELSATLSMVRAENDGHIYFLMNADGAPRFDRGGRPGRDIYTFADIFCAKGLYSAAHHRGDAAGAAQAREYLTQIERSLWEFRFRNLQFTPGSPVSNDDPRRVRQEGPFMIFLGALAVFAEREGGAWCTGAGLGIIERILSRHTAAADAPPLARRGDMWEAVDEHDRPHLSAGRLISDPGHSIEFVGLASRFLRAIEHRGELTDSDARRAAAARARLPELLFANFENGFRRPVGGITKTIDLITRAPIDPNLPWWSLPETMRAAAEVHAGSETPAGGAANVRDQCLSLFALCHNALVERYLVPGDPQLWVQTRGADGSIVDVIPSCADVDPGYHTNLSIIEALELLLPRIDEHRERAEDKEERRARRSNHDGTGG